ncbi:MAG: cobalamin-dependent protein, partial [Pseudomonadota bacterium]
MTHDLVPYRPKNKVRVVTATSLFDGHDAAINIMRRILQDSGAEVIHLGHNRSVSEIVEAAIQEDAQAIAVSCYQGGHMEFFKYIVDLLREKGAPHIKVFGGGGGVIIPPEIRELQEYGVTRIYSPEDGRSLGLQGMINDLLQTIDRPYNVKEVLDRIGDLSVDNYLTVAKVITAIELAKAGEDGYLPGLRAKLEERRRKTVPTLGVTGPGGSGKSSLVDELVNRFLNDFEDKSVGILSVDPSRRKTGGALLGDRIRFNSISRERVYLRSLATRESNLEISAALEESVLALRAAGFDLIIVETAGIGQGNAAVAPLVDLTLYVMTSEYGAASQLEKIDMLDFADVVTINKFDRKGSEDALRDVRKQYQRNRKLFDRSPAEMPVYGTIAARFNDDGVNALYLAVLEVIAQKTGVVFKSSLPRPEGRHSSSKTIIIPPERTRYLAEIAQTVRDYHEWVEAQAETAERLWRIDGALAELDPEPEKDGLRQALQNKRAELAACLEAEAAGRLEEFPRLKEMYAAEEFVSQVRAKEFRTPMSQESLAGTRIPRVALPEYRNP